MDLRDFINILRRQKYVIAGTTVLGTILGFIFITQIPPRYGAETVIMLETRKTQVVDFQSVVSGMAADAATIRSEVEILKSSTMAEKVVERLKLTDNPEFNPSLRPPSFWATYNPVALARSAIASFRSKAPSAAQSHIDEHRARVVDAAGILDSAVTVDNDGKSYVLKIDVELHDPQLAADVANAYAETYLLSQLEAKYDATKRANNWLNDRIGDLREKVSKAEQEVEAYREKNNLGEVSKGTTITAQQLAEVNSQLIAAAADRAQKEANLRQIQQMMRTPGGADAAAQVLASSLIQSMRQQETDILRKQAEMATRYKPGHPAMVNIEAELKDLRAKIADEVGKISRGMASEVASARSREDSLRTSLSELQQQASSQGKADVGLRELEREAQANRALYENFLTRFKQTSNEDVQQADARLISTANVSSAPSYPNKGQLTGAAFFASLILGVFAAFGMERLDNGFRNAEQIEKATGVATLGLVPTNDSNESPLDIVVKYPTRSFSESIRTIRTALRYSDIDHPPKVVLVTSTLHAEGKTVFAACLARSVARSGARALLIECDLRKPSLSRYLGNHTRGMPGVLTMADQVEDLTELVQVDPESKMHFIPAVGGTSNPQDLLGSDQMRRFLERMRHHYDFIVLDSPPVLAVSDALILSHFADTTMFLIRWERTPRQLVTGALRMFQANGTRLAGVVLSRVDVKKHALYGYGDHGYYYGRYGNYYHEPGLPSNRLQEPGAPSARL